MNTSIEIEVLCEECGGLRKDGGAFCRSMASACAIAKRHNEITSHRSFARLTQETVYA